MKKHIFVMVMAAAALTLAACDGLGTGKSCKHQWGEWENITIPATCTTAGKGLRTCSVCGATRTYIPALGHDWDEWTETAAANCTYPGEEVHNCQRAGCGETEIKTIPIDPGAHSWSIVSTATCVAAGTEKKTCIFNHEHTESKEAPLDPNAHVNWQGGTITTQATCTTDGIITGGGCSACGASGNSIIPALGHDWSGAWMQTTPPTCEEHGIDSLACRNTGCTEIQTRTGAAALGHNWGVWITIPATYIAPGGQTRTCIRDASHTETDAGSIPQLIISSTANWAAAANQVKEKNGGNYTLLIGSNFYIPGIVGFTESNFGEPDYPLNVTLQASGSGIRTISLSSIGHIIRLTGRTTVTLDSNITLQGRSDNNVPLVELYDPRSGLIMNSGSKISGNTNKTSSSQSCAGVYVVYGTLTLNGGEISGNTGTTAIYGGVMLSTSGVLTMNSGTISGNSGRCGGVYIGGGIFNMNGGSIMGNTGSAASGGVYLDSGLKGTFHMNGGTIHGSNSAANKNSTLVDMGAALYVASDCIAEYGTWSGTTWNKKGTLSTSDNEIRVVNGVLQ